MVVVEATEVVATVLVVATEEVVVVVVGGTLLVVVVAAVVVVVEGLLGVDEHPTSHPTIAKEQTIRTIRMWRLSRRWF